MMPAAYTMDTIPVPDDPSVVLREILAHRAAAIRYSGRWSEASYKKHLASLQDWMKLQNLTAIGEPVCLLSSGKPRVLSRPQAVHCTDAKPSRTRMSSAKHGRYELTRL